MSLIDKYAIFNWQIEQLIEKQVVSHEHFMVFITQDLIKGHWDSNFCIISSDSQSITRLYEPILKNLDIPQTIHFSRTLFEGDRPPLLLIQDETTHLIAILIQTHHPEQIHQLIDTFTTEV